MKDIPCGCRIILEGRAKKKEVDLVSTGSKYNRKKVLVFVCSKGAGTTAAGEPCLVKFPDSFGNVCIRQVARPTITSRYFDYSNQVDVHNQGRQYNLAVEKKWVTHDGWFCLYTSIV